MIHISQEELLKKIEEEHKQLFESQLETESAQQANGTRPSKAGPQASPSRRTGDARGCKDASILTEPSTSASASLHPESTGETNSRQAQAAAPSQDSPANQDMSSLLPTAYGNIRDRNNNSNRFANNDNDDDEIQAVLITGKPWQDARTYSRWLDPT